MALPTAPSEPRAELRRLLDRGVRLTARSSRAPPAACAPTAAACPHGARPLTQDDPAASAEFLSAAEPGVAELAELGRLPLLPPLARAVVSSPFGPRRSPFTGAPGRHLGVDLIAPRGTPVRAAGSGRVVRAGWDGPFGLTVEIDHGNGLRTRYAHLARILVRPGALVEAGRPIGRLGDTGRTTGPHLHYEVHLAGTPVDPLRVMEAGRLLAVVGAGTTELGLDGRAVEAYGPIGVGGEVEP